MSFSFLKVEERTKISPLYMGNSQTLKLELATLKCRLHQKKSLLSFRLLLHEIYAFVWKCSIKTFYFI